MGLFSSRQERRLWLFALAIVVAIYSTLGLAATLAEELRNRNLFDAAFFGMFILVIATVVAQSVKMRRGKVEIALILGITAVYVLVFLRMAIPEERTHLIEYGVLGLFIFEALNERASNSRRVLVPAVIAVVVTAALGLLDESIQAVLPNRYFGWQDVGFNALAGVMAVGARVSLAWARRRVTGSSDEVA